MALVIDPLKKGLRGRVGDLIYRTRGNKTFAYMAPEQKKKRILQTPLQQQNSALFKEAVAYAKRILMDPEMHLRYKAAIQDAQSANNVAMRDYFLPPVIHEINTDNYFGNKGDIITIKATDDFEVISVMISTYAADGKLLESGEAVPSITKNEWCYNISKSNNRLVGTSIVVEAKDHPRNSTFLSVTIQ